MANDMDMLNDIEDLKNLKHFKQAEDLEQIFHEWQWGFDNDKKLKRLIKQYEKKYNDNLDEFGIF